MSETVMRMEEQNTSVTVRNANHSVRKENSARIPTQLKERMQKSTGMPFDNVRVCYNSDLPMRLDALAYTKENPVEISSGRESHLPHALGHVVQQKLGIVHANATNFYGAARSIDVGRVHQANGSSTRKRAAIIQRMKNEVVQRCEEDESEKEQQQYKVPEETVSKEPVVASGDINREEALKRTDERIKKEIDDIMNENKGKIKKDRYRPTKISAVIDIRNGNMYIGYSGKKETNRTPNADKEIHPELSDRIKRTQESAKNEEGNPHKNSESFEEWSVDNCAEVYAVNNALYNGVPWDKMYINTWFFADPRYAPPCENCKRTFSGVEGLRRGESG